jgi:hypothetical protein
MTRGLIAAMGTVAVVVAAASVHAQQGRGQGPDTVERQMIDQLLAERHLDPLAAIAGLELTLTPVKDNPRRHRQGGRRHAALQHGRGESRQAVHPDPARDHSRRGVADRPRRQHPGLSRDRPQSTVHLGRQLGESREIQGVRPDVQDRQRGSGGSRDACQPGDHGDRRPTSHHHHQPGIERDYRSRDDRADGPDREGDRGQRQEVRRDWQVRWTATAVPLSRFLLPLRNQSDRDCDDAHPGDRDVVRPLPRNRECHPRRHSPPTATRVRTSECPRPSLDDDCYAGGTRCDSLSGLLTAWIARTRLSRDALLAGAHLPEGDAARLLPDVDRTDDRERLKIDGVDLAGC